MGGLYAYRYRRRYYTSYNDEDSHFDALGMDLVREVPTDPAKYKKWVEKLKADLERKYKLWKASMKMYNEDSRTMKILPQCPFSMRAPTLDVFFELTYVLDLDRNVFTVNELAHLPLDAIPRGVNGGAWIAAVLDPQHPARIPAPSPTVSPPDPRHLALYDAEISTQTLCPLLDTSSFPYTTCGVLMDYFFRQLRFAYSPVLDCIEQYEANHPDFRALAQAFLALATWGHFRMSFKAFGPNRIESDVYPVRTIDPDWSHLEMDDADTHFWYLSTLIVLDIGLDDEQRLRAAVGMTIELWRAMNMPGKNATAFVISLKSVVVVHFSNGAVSHSAPIELCGAITESQPPFLTSSHTPGFELLKRHFTPALLPAVDSSWPLALPADIVERILDIEVCDDTTLQNLGQTCKAVRALCLARPRFSVGEYRLLHHVAGNEFTALDTAGVSTPVVAGKVGVAVPKPLPGGQGHNLIIRTQDAKYDVLLSILGLRCVSKARFGHDAANVAELIVWTNSHVGR